VTECVERVVILSVQGSTDIGMTSTFFSDPLSILKIKHKVVYTLSSSLAK